MSKGSKSLDELTTISSREEGNFTPGAAPTIEQARSRKRKRAGKGEEIEDKYLRRLANEEQKSRIEAKKSDKHVQALRGDEDDDAQPSGSEEASEIDDASSNGGGVEPDDYTIPKHESLAPNGAADELEKAARTVFLGNVSTVAIKSKASKKVLLDHLASIFESMKDSKDQKVESIRFRSTAFSDGSLPKKAAFVKRELMDATTQSTNAYAVYSTTAAAREAVKSLNGTIVLDRHLRVDSVAHPSAIDHRRCVFIGNLGFVDDESIIRKNEAEDGNARVKAKVAADVEEGLWIHFAKAGPVESVRVVRDRNTRVGKGIAYIQFKVG